VAATAAVVMALAIPREQKTAPLDVQAPALAQSTPASSAGAIAPPIEAASDAGGPSTPAARRRAPRPPAVNPVLAAWRERAVAPLPGARALAIDRIEPARIQPTDLGIPLMEVEPLGTTPLSVAPVGSSSGG
jgi:hypothetical protein